jgi:hypothetical protein
MLKSIAKALTRHLLQDNPGIRIHEVSGRVAGFIKAVQWRVSPHSQAGGLPKALFQYGCFRAGLLVNDPFSGIL